jgi:hypothetical protein
MNFEAPHSENTWELSMLMGLCYWPLLHAELSRRERLGKSCARQAAERQDTTIRKPTKCIISKITLKYSSVSATTGGLAGEHEPTLQMHRTLLHARPLGPRPHGNATAFLPSFPAISSQLIPFFLRL